MINRMLLAINGIPAVLWGNPSDKLFIAVHGDQSHKEDAVIAILAEEAEKKGYQVLSFDLPEHGDRKEESRQCDPQNAVEDLAEILAYARTHFSYISLFGCSIGAYFSMIAYQNEPYNQTLFLSPVVDMERLIQNMMSWFDVSEEKLRQEEEVETPIKTLSWDYYQYVVGNPVAWEKPTAILYGAQDNLCEFEVVSRFANQNHADMTVLENGEHFFHTEEHLFFFRQWLQCKIG